MTLDDQLLLAKAAGYEDAEIIANRVFVVFGEWKGGTFDPYSPDTCLRLMEKLKIDVTTSKAKAGDSIWWAEVDKYMMYAPTIPEAVALCALEVLKDG